MDTKEFLKTHSPIPNTFIDSFLSFYNPDTTQTDLVINLDTVAKWLGTQKKSLLSTLKTTYKVNIDYSIKKTTNKKGKYGGNNYKRVYISPDCFKRLCMRSKTKKSEEVRTYFIELESLISKYKTHLLSGLKQEITSLENQLKPKDHVYSDGYIYILRASKEKDSIYKIGRTKDLNKRLSSYSTGHLEHIEVLYTYRTNNLLQVENCVKNWLKQNQYRKYKELYEADIDMIKALIARCDGFQNIIETYRSKKASQMTGGYYLFLQKE